MAQGVICKLIWVSIIFMIALNVVGYAAENIQQSPIEHWVYQEMELLYQSGMLTDYPSAWVNSGNQLSRFEIAYYLKQFIVHNPETKEIPADSLEKIQHLIGEFRSELNDLGIQITDIYKISPDLSSSANETSDYRDLDTILNSNIELSKNHYYYGQYFSELQRKSFLFIPITSIQSNDLQLLVGDNSGINIVYQPQISSNPSFLVIKGNLPINTNQSLSGFYLFPITEDKNIFSHEIGGTSNFNNQVLALLEEVNQIKQVDNLYQFKGELPLEGYLRLETDFYAKPLVGNLNQGLKIGGLLIFTENPSVNNKFEVNNFGLPLFNRRQIGPSNVEDLDAINGKNLQSLQINISGLMSLSPQTSVYGGLDFLFRGTNTGLNNLWPSDTKASAGVNFQLNDYFTVLTYQSFVNSQLRTGLLSTTSVGVDYNEWITLWLAYQLLNFDQPVLSGTVSFRF